MGKMYSLKRNYKLDNDILNGILNLTWNKLCKSEYQRSYLTYQKFNISVDKKYVSDYFYIHASLYPKSQKFTVSVSDTYSNWCLIISFKTGFNGEKFTKSKNSKITISLKEYNKRTRNFDDDYARMLFEFIGYDHENLL